MCWALSDLCYHAWALHYFWVAEFTGEELGARKSNLSNITWLRSERMGIRIYQFKCYLLSEARPPWLNWAPFQNLFMYSLDFYLAYLIVHCYSPSKIYTYWRQGFLHLVSFYAPSAFKQVYNRYNSHREMCTEWTNEWMTVNSPTVLAMSLHWS